MNPGVFGRGSGSSFGAAAFGRAWFVTDLCADGPGAALVVLVSALALDEALFVDDLFLDDLALAPLAPALDEAGVVVDPFADGAGWTMLTNRLLLDHVSNFEQSVWRALAWSKIA